MLSNVFSYYRMCSLTVECDGVQRADGDRRRRHCHLLRQVRHRGQGPCLCPCVVCVCVCLSVCACGMYAQGYMYTRRYRRRHARALTSACVCLPFLCMHACIQFSLYVHACMHAVSMCTHACTHSLHACIRARMYEQNVLKCLHRTCKCVHCCPIITASHHHNPIYHCHIITTTLHTRTLLRTPNAARAARGRHNRDRVRETQKR